MQDYHQVITKSLDFVSSPVTVVAGTGTVGSTSNMLNKPRGIFVDINFDLYVADFLIIEFNYFDQENQME